MSIHRSYRHSGQSLVELTMVMIVLLPVLMAGIFGGMSLYQGTLASEAIKEPTIHKIEMADTASAVSNAQLLGYSTGMTASMMPGSLLDNINIVNVNNDTAIMVGRKRGVTIPVLNMTFDFTVSQAIQSRLLNAVTATVTDSPTVPYGSNTQKAPPWSDPLIATLQTSLLECSNAVVSNSAVDAVFPNAPNGSSYLSRKQISYNSPYSAASIAQLAREPQVVSACQSEQTTINQQCDAEYNQLLPHADPIVLGCPQAATPTGTPAIVCPTGTTASPDGLTCTYTGSTTTTSADIAALQQQIATLSATLNASTSTCATYSSYIYNPPGSPGMRIAATQNANGGFTSTTTGFLAPDAGLYFDPTGKYITPPASMRTDCQQRKLAECKVEKAINLAQQINAKFPQECAGP